MTPEQNRKEVLEHLNGGIAQSMRAVLRDKMETETDLSKKLQLQKTILEIENKYLQKQKTP